MKRKNIFFLFSISLIAFCFTFTKLAFPQLVFEDAKGEEVLIQYWGSAITVNTANESIKFGFTIRNRDDWALGFDVSGKATNGIATLLKGGNLTAGFKANLNIGCDLYTKKWIEIADSMEEKIRKNKEEKEKKIENKYKEKLKKLQQDISISEEEKQKKKDLLLNKEKREKETLHKDFTEVIDELYIKLPKQRNWINLRLGYEKEGFKLFSPEASIENQITNEVFNGLSVQLSYSSYFHDYDTLLSFSVGFTRANNASLLKKVALTDETVYGISDENMIRSSKKTFNARQGTFETFNLGYILLSSFWKPSKLPFGVITYGRYNYSRLARSLNLGTGIYILKSKEKSLVPLGGLVVEYEDKFDCEMKDVSFGDRITVNLAVTLPLFMKK